MTLAPKPLVDKLAEIERCVRGRKPAEPAKPGKPSKPKAKVVTLPIWPDAQRAIPNHLARSSLFAPVARGRRKLHVDAELASRSDARILFSGQQLDEADCDVFMQAMHEARRVPLGEPVTINRAQFLRAIGRATGKQNYEWLHASFKRLAFAMLSIETKRYTIGTPRSEVMHLVDGFSHDPEADTYVLRIDPRMLVLYGNREFARIDRDKRLRIEHQADMAKWLQRLVATSGDAVQRYALDELKERMQYASPMRKFKEALMAALCELERLRIIADPEIGTSTRGVEQAAWKLPQAMA